MHSSSAEANGELLMGIGVALLSLNDASGVTSFELASQVSVPMETVLEHHRGGDGISKRYNEYR